MEKKLQKIYPTYYNLLIAQDLWQVHHQILLIIFSGGIHQIKFGHDDKKCEHVELNISGATVFWNTQILKMI